MAGFLHYQKKTFECIIGISNTLLRWDLSGHTVFFKKSAGTLYGQWVDMVNSTDKNGVSILFNLLVYIEAMAHHKYQGCHRINPGSSKSLRQ